MKEFPSRLLVPIATLVGILLALATFSNAQISPPNYFTYWGPGPLSQGNSIAACIWLDPIRERAYRYGGGSRLLFGQAGSAQMFALDLVSTNSSTGMYEPQWIEINATRSVVAVYPENPGDPDSPDLWPGGRAGSLCYTDTVTTPGDTLFWLYGGYSMISESNFAMFEDLWYFSSMNGTWRFMGGRKFAAYTTEPVPEGYPGPREFGTMLLNPEKTHIYIVGGAGLDNSDIQFLPATSFYNASRFSLSTRTWTTLPGPDPVPAAAPVGYIWFACGDFVYMFSLASRRPEDSLYSVGPISMRYEISTNTWSEYMPRDGTAPTDVFLGIAMERAAGSNIALFYGGFDGLPNYSRKFRYFDCESETVGELFTVQGPFRGPIGVPDPSTGPLYGSRSSSVVYKGRLYLSGGADLGGAAPDLFTYDFSCPNGSIVLASGGCQICPAGTYAINSYDACRPCAAGFTSQSGATECTACPEGTYGVYNANLLRSECTPCPGGTFGSLTAQTSCRPCGRGFISNEGATNCSSCPTGFYSNETTLNKCLLCPLGQYVAPTADGCLSCQDGQTTTSPGQVACDACDETNLYSNSSTGFMCVVCPRGSIANVNRSSCSLCPPTKYHPGPRVTFCLLCPDGTTSGNGSETCNPCPPGTYSNAQTNLTCQSCPQNFLPALSRGFCVPIPPPQDPTNQERLAAYPLAFGATVAFAILLALAVVGLIMALVLKFRRRKLKDSSKHVSSAGPSTALTAMPSQSQKAQREAEQSSTETSESPSDESDIDHDIISTDQSSSGSSQSSS